MKRLLGLFAFSLVVCLLRYSAAAQEPVGINFFDISQAYKKSFTYWDNGRSYVYLGGSASFARSAGNAVPVDMSVGNGSLVFQTTMPGGWWNVEFKLDVGHSVNFLRYGENPLLHLRLKWGSIAAGADADIQLIDDQSIWNLYYNYNGTGTTRSNQAATVRLSNYVAPSTQWQDVYIPMTAFLANNPNLDLTRISVLKFYGVGTYSAANTMYIEKMKIVSGATDQYADMIKINQLGYTPQGRKLAIVSYEPGAAAAPSYFQLKDADTGTVAFQAGLQPKSAPSFQWDGSGDIVFHADFTSFTQPGFYVLFAPEIGQVSPVFEIGENTYNAAFADSLRFFYYARSGNAIAEPFAKGHARPAIYQNNSACAYDYDDNNASKMYDYDPQNTGITTRDVRGGWFDAGDLHLDIHNNITTLWFLLETLEQFQGKLGPNLLLLPESDGQINDLVWLLKYQIDWFKKMQNPDGSVHFMVIADGSDQRRQYVSDVSSGAACVLAGIFAKASPLFSSVPGMESYAADLLSRAELSWSWLTAHTSTYNPTGKNGQTWSYGITNDTPYRGFAAVELYLATGNNTYRTYFETRFNAASGNKVLNAFGGNSYYGYIGLIGNSAISKAYMDYAETSRPVSTTIQTLIRNSFLAEADKLVSNVTDQTRTYRVPMLMSNDLYWGSSGVICGNAYVLLKAFEWTGNAAYRNAATDALDWISGRNPVSRVFITGYGDYLHGTDHYSFYMFDHLNPVPGYLCGNINCIGYGSNWLDAHIQYPWKYYLNIQNASLLEPCLHWQSQMCYLLGYFAGDLKKPGDLNFDNTLNMPDLMLFAHAWLSTDGHTGWNPYADLAKPTDGIISYPDFAALASQWLSAD